MISLRGMAYLCLPSNIVMRDPIKCHMMQTLEINIDLSIALINKRVTRDYSDTKCINKTTSSHNITVYVCDFGHPRLENCNVRHNIGVKETSPNPSNHKPFSKCA